MLVVQMATLFLPLFILPYVSRAIGPDGYGTIIFVFAISQVVVMLSDYGFNLIGPRDIALCRQDKKEVVSIWLNIIVAKLLICIVSFVFILLFSFIYIPFQTLLPALGLSFFSVIGAAISPFWLLQGFEKLILISVVQLVGRIIPFLLYFLFVKGPGDLLVAVSLQALGNLLPALVSYFFLSKFVDFKELRLLELRRLKYFFRSGWDLFISNSAVTLYTSVNMVFLGFIISPNLVANYGIADKFVKAIQSLYAPISNAFFPRIVTLIRDDPEKAKSLITRLFFYGGGVAFSVSLFLYYFCPFLVNFVFDEAYVSALSVLRLSIWIPFLVVLSNVVGVLGMVPFGLTAEFRRILAVAAVSNCVIFPIGTFFWSIEGAACANLAVEIFVVSLMVISLKKRKLFL